MISILIADDSPVVALFLAHILDSEPDMHVDGKASNGEEAVEIAKNLRPDIIIMDIHMPKMDGLEATKKIMEVVPTPVIIVTASLDKKEVSMSFHALETGALAIMQKPCGSGNSKGKESVGEFINMVRLMSEVKVVRRWTKNRNKELPLTTSACRPANLKDIEIEIIAIGASTGGPLALQTILSGITKKVPVPILVVQHISPGFTDGFAEWLSKYSILPINIASDGDYCMQGNVYVAPDNYHMGVSKDRKIVLGSSAPENGHKPSVSYLFRSVAENFGICGIGILLTGMGRDGAYELKMMREKGAITVAQDRESSVIYGMPGEAARIEAAEYILSINQIFSMINRL